MLSFNNSNTPRSLVSDTNKATKVLLNFVKPNQVGGQYPLIPTHVLKKAKGLVIISLVEAGFLLSGRTGSGIIIAKLNNGSWSAPVAIGMLGTGAGGQMGFEKTDIVFVLNDQDAVNDFIQFGDISFNGKLTIAAGPVNIISNYDATTLENDKTSIYLYSRSKGLFAGFSAKSSRIIERVEENRKAYGINVTTTDILSGKVTAPYGSEKLYKLLNCRAFDFTEFNSHLRCDEVSFTSSENSINFNGNNNDYNKEKQIKYSYYSEDNSENYISNSRRGRSPSFRSINDEVLKENKRNFDRENVSYSEKAYSNDQKKYLSPNTTRNLHKRNLSDSNFVEYSSYANNDSKNYTPRSKQYVIREQVIALYDFDGIEEDDLKFKKGDLLNVVTKTKSTFDWWTGELEGKKGLFPANYVKPIYNEKASNNYLGK